MSLAFPICVQPRLLVDRLRAVGCPTSSLAFIRARRFFQPMAEALYAAGDPVSLFLGLPSCSTGGLWPSDHPFSLSRWSGIFPVGLAIAGVFAC